MKRITEEGSHPIKAWLGMKEVPKYSFEENYPGETTQVLDLEAAALTQLKSIARLPFILPQGVAVMALQADLVEVVHTLKAHLCVKGN